MIGKRFFLFFIFIVFMFLNVILFSEEYPVIGSKNKICILAYNTEFKRNLTSALVKDFNDKKISVMLDTVSNSSQYSAKDYDAVILLSGVKMGNQLSGAVKFLKTNNYSSNIIYVIAHGKNYKISNNNKIDVISSASITNNDIAFDEIKNKIIEKVMKVIK